MTHHSPYPRSVRVEFIPLEIEIVAQDDTMG